MNLRLPFSFILLSIFLLNGFSQEAERNILKNAITKERLEVVLQSQEAFKPLPPLADPKWSTIDGYSRNRLVEKGEKYLDYDWPSLLAVRYMDFDIDGNRTRYSDPYYSRRNVLADLCMAEILENKGRFINDIINGLWLILEETTWVVPAHSDGDKLHDYNDVTVDLFNAETAALLSWVDYFFGDTFDEITPLIRKRIYAEVDRRVIQSMLDHNNFWYMGYGSRVPNNWNPWIVSNWITAVLLLEKDETKRVESIWKALDILDNYLNPHPFDGGCDEGPSYWGRAGASLFDCLFLLNTATKGNFNVFHDPLIKNMGSYIYKIHIKDNWYVNFADGSANIQHQAGTLFRIGKAMEDKTMMAMAAEQFRNTPANQKVPNNRSPFGQRTLPDLLILDELASYSADYINEKDYFFPNLEVLVSREKEDKSGFFMAIKGGFNNESHNHNDAGSFVIFYDGLPLFVDAGVGTYTRKTFSDQRYDIWTMQSAFHNLPTLNGEMQNDGFEYKAKDFTFESKGTSTSVTMDISDAYPDYAYTDYWIRSLEMNRRAGWIELTDTWEQEKQLKRNQWHFILAYEPVAAGKGKIKITNGKSDLLLKYSNHFFSKIEKIEIDDERLSEVWGDSLWRITLTTGKKGLKGKETFTIQKSE